MKVFKSERWADQDTLIPDRVNAELENYVGEINGRLDANNVTAGTITGAKVALDTFNQIVVSESSAALVVTRNNENQQQWFTLEELSITTGDGRLEIEGSATWTTTLANVDYVDLGVLVDGAVVARAGASPPAQVSAWSSELNACPPVGPGSHTVALVVRLNPGQDDPGTAPAITANGRLLWVRHMRR